MEISIKPAETKDLSDIISLMYEFAVFENLEDNFFVNEEKLGEILFGDTAFAKCLVAFSEEEMIAFAIVFPVFKTFRGERSLYLEDLYVKRTFRSFGVGLKMLKEVVRLAKQMNCVRMDWQTLNWNRGAINFYHSIDAEINEENVDFRLIGESFEQFAS